MLPVLFFLIIMTDAIKTLDADVELNLLSINTSNVEVEDAKDLVQLMKGFVEDYEREIILCKCVHKGWGDGFISYVLIVEGYNCAFVYRHKVKEK